MTPATGPLSQQLSSVASGPATAAVSITTAAAGDNETSVTAVGVDVQRRLFKPLPPPAPWAVPPMPAAAVATWVCVLPPGSHRASDMYLSTGKGQGASSHGPRMEFAVCWRSTTYARVRCCCPYAHPPHARARKRTRLCTGYGLGGITSTHRPLGPANATNAACNVFVGNATSSLVSIHNRPQPPLPLPLRFCRQPCCRWHLYSSHTCFVTSTCPASGDEAPAAAGIGGTAHGGGGGKIATLWLDQATLGIQQSQTSRWHQLRRWRWKQRQWQAPRRRWPAAGTRVRVDSDVLVRVGGARRGQQHRLLSSNAAFERGRRPCFCACACTLGSAGPGPCHTMRARVACRVRGRPKCQRAWVRCTSTTVAKRDTGDF